MEEVKIERGALMLCYGCLKAGTSLLFDIPAKCPKCGSLEVWPAASDVWSDEEVRQQRGQVSRMFSDHGHGGDWSREVRENCGACCLGGYRPRGGWGDDYPEAPNYAGWQRAYVQAGRVIRKRWAGEFLRALEGKGIFSEALRRDVFTYGLRIESGSVA